MNRQDEIDRLIQKANAFLPQSPRDKEIATAIAKWKREHPGIARRFEKQNREE